MSRHLSLTRRRQAALSFIAMYALMYAMVDRANNVFGNLNQFYMAGLMTAAMLLIELGVMRGMYENRRWNVLIAGGSVAALALFWLFTRQQAAISDEQFLRSMIPHHAGAILMCEEASLRSPQIRELCARIVSSQRAEISEMRALLAAVDSER